MKKFRLTKNKKEFMGITFYQIEALIDFSDVKKGDLGGWVENENNLSQDGNCWIYDNAYVFENARVYDNAHVCDNAHVYGNAQIYGDALVCGNALVYGNAWVYGNARVYDNAWVYGKLKLIDGYFYHTKEKSENIEKIENDENYETLCYKHKLDEEEKLVGKKVKIRLANNQIVEGYLEE